MLLATVVLTKFIERKLSCATNLSAVSDLNTYTGQNNQRLILLTTSPWRKINAKLLMELTCPRPAVKYAIASKVESSLIVNVLRQNVAKNFM